MIHSPASTVEEYLDRLIKRRDFLSVRIEKGNERGLDLSYDKAEFNALDFTVDLMLANQSMTIDYMERWLLDKNRNYT